MTNPKEEAPASGEYSMLEHLARQGISVQRL